MADLPHPKKKKIVNTDDEETVVIKVDPAKYNKQKLDNADTAKIPASQIRQASRNYNNQNNRNNRNANYNRNNSQGRAYGNRTPQNGNGNRSNNPNRQNVYHGNGNRQQPPQRSSRSPQQNQVRNPRPNNYQAAPVKKKKKNLVTKILKIVLIAAVAIFIIYSVIVLISILRVNKVSDGSRSRTAGAMESSNVTNVLLIGTDSRDLDEERGRSDSMILFSLNSSSHNLYLSSFMRDAYVEIPRYGNGKLNAAYSYGGAELLMDTIESNYNIAIDSYVSVSFSGFASIIDSVGGVKVTLSDSEAEALNIILQSEVNEIMGDDVNDDLLDGGGDYTLNGKQALSYSRIRYVGNADFERTERQRSVMTQVISKVKSMNPVYITSLLNNSIPNLTTNMQASELYLLSLRLPTLLFYDTCQQQIPADGTWSSADVNGESVLQVDFDANIDILEDTVFES